MTTDSKRVYPSAELIDSWRDEHLQSGLGSLLSAFIARKACDWQRQQDALICDAAFADPNWNALLRNGALVCADSIRACHPIQAPAKGEA